MQDPATWDAEYSVGPEPDREEVTRNLGELHSPKDRTELPLGGEGSHRIQHGQTGKRGTWGHGGMWQSRC